MTKGAAELAKVVAKEKLSIAGSRPRMQERVANWVEVRRGEEASFFDRSVVRQMMTVEDTTRHATTTCRNQGIAQTEQ